MTEEQVQALYTERNRLVAALVRVALDNEWPVGVSEDDEAVGWPVVLIDLPSGQVSWHIHPDDFEAVFPPLPHYKGVWDGHTTPEKYERLLRFTQDR